MKRTLKRFISDTSAQVAFESVIIFPILVWAWIGTFAFFDAYRVYNTSIKATFTIADLISRQESFLYASDLEGYGRMLEALIRDTYGVDMRVTQIVRAENGDYVIDGDHSYATGNQARLFNANIPALQDQLPSIDYGEYLILVESFVNYRPPFNVGLNDIAFENFTVTRPRMGRVPFDFGDTTTTTTTTSGGG